MGDVREKVRAACLLENERLVLHTWRGSFLQNQIAPLSPPVFTSYPYFSFSQLFITFALFSFVGISRSATIGDGRRLFPYYFGTKW